MIARQHQQEWKRERESEKGAVEVMKAATKPDYYRIETDSQIILKKCTRA